MVTIRIGTLVLFGLLCCVLAEEKVNDTDRTLASLGRRAIALELARSELASEYLALGRRAVEGGDAQTARLVISALGDLDIGLAGLLGITAAAKFRENVGFPKIFQSACLKFSTELQGILVCLIRIGALTEDYVNIRISLSEAKDHMPNDLYAYFSSGISFLLGDVEGAKTEFSVLVQNPRRLMPLLKEHPINAGAFFGANRKVSP